jgi:membrane-associated phospholipid phosphatase
LKRKYFLCFGILLSVIFRLQAGSADTVSYPKLDKNYIKSYWYDTKAFVASPANWRKKQWIGLGVVAGAGVVAYSQDERIQKYFVNHQSTTADNFTKYVFEPFGSFSPVIVGGLYIGGRLVKDNRLAGTSLTAGKALIVAGAFSVVVKQLTHRHRPFQDDVPDHANWDGPFSSIEYNSFPSGHSTAAFSMATVYAMEYWNTIWVPVLAYTLATGTAVSRVYDNRHWTSDVVIGSALGFVTGRFMWKQSRKGNSRLIILPSANTHSASVTCLFRIG